MKLVTLFMATGIFSGSLAFAQNAPAMDDAALERRVQVLVQKMTTAEKAAQLDMYSGSKFITNRV